MHADLATAAPFPSHNGIVARAAERLVLVARGVDDDWDEDDWDEDEWDDESV